MGNRAVVTFANKKDIEQWIDPKGDGEKLNGYCADHPHSIGVYLHWNGGRASIEGFCEACRRLKFRGAASDSYGVARFTQAVCNFFGNDGLSCGVDTLEHSDCNNYDNGVYVVDDSWNIVGREFANGEQNDYDVNKFAEEVVASMPEKE
jgi:hypothetical protein